MKRIDKNGKPITSDGVQMFEVPNTPEGRAFIESMSKYLNTEVYRRHSRGRGSRKNGKGWQSHISVPNSEWIAVYVNSRNQAQVDAQKHNLLSSLRSLRTQLDSAKSNVTVYKSLAQRRLVEAQNTQGQNERNRKTVSNLSQTICDLEQKLSEATQGKANDARITITIEGSNVKVNS